MDKQLVGQLPDITQSSNDDEIMIITDIETNQLRKEKISDFITDLISVDANNGLNKGNDGKMFVVDAANADNITSGTLPVDRLPNSGVSAGSYPYPVNLQVNDKGQIVSVQAGEPGANNANTDLSNITEAGKEIIKQNSGSSLPIGTMFFSQGFVDETKGLQIKANGQILSNNANTKGFINWVAESAALNPDFATTEQNWQAEAALSPDGVCGKYVINYGTDNEIVSVRLPKMPDWAVQSIYGNVPVIPDGLTVGLTDGINNFGLIYSSDGNRILAHSNDYGVPTGSAIASGSVNPKVNTTLGFASKTGLKALLSDITSTKIKGAWYIQIATGQKTEVNITNKIELNSPYSLMDFKYTPGPVYNLSWKQGGSTITKAAYPALYNAFLIENNPEIEVGTTSNIDGWQYTKRGWPEVKLSTDSDITDYDVVLDKTAESAILPSKAKVTYLDVSKSVPVVPADLTKTTPFTDGVNSYGFSTNGYASNTSRLFSSIDDSTATVGTTGTLKPSSNNIVGRIGDVDGYTNLVTNLSSLASNDFYLYWYVGKTVQNANLIDVARIEEIKANITQLDGPWGPSSGFSMSDIALPVLNETTPLHFDLSDVLPNDGNEYEIRFTVEIQTAAKQFAGVNVDIFGVNNYNKGKLQVGITTPANVVVSTIQSGTAVIGADRRLQINYYNGTAAGKILNFWLNSIRRKGIV